MGAGAYAVTEQEIQDRLGAYRKVAEDFRLATEAADAAWTALVAIENDPKASQRKVWDARAAWEAATVRAETIASDVRGAAESFRAAVEYGY